MFCLLCTYYCVVYMKPLFIEYQPQICRTKECTSLLFIFVYRTVVLFVLCIIQIPRHSDINVIKAIFKRMFSEPQMKVHLLVNLLMSRTYPASKYFVPLSPSPPNSLHPLPSPPSPFTFSRPHPLPPPLIPIPSTPSLVLPPSSLSLLQIYSIFLETLSVFIEDHREHIEDWLFLILLRLLHRHGSDLLGHMHYKLQLILELIRCTFQ